MASQVRPEELSKNEGEYLVRIARRAVEHYFEHREKLRPPEDVPPILRRPGASFVTIMTYYDYYNRELRGCIGYIRPVKSLIETVIDVALEAAFNDPRFPPMTRDELERVTFEVSVLSPLEPLPQEPEKRVASITIGRDGLVVSKGLFQGLLLPEVPVEYLWDEETFLAETCVKAGLPPHCWLDSDTEFYRYYTRNWREKEPLGEIEERNLRKEYEELLAKYSKE